MKQIPNPKPIEILLVEDNPGDIRLTQEAFREGKMLNIVKVARDGVDGLAFLRHEGKYAHEHHPGIILLDLNLPKMDGRELLGIIKSDPALRRIPVVILTTSKSEEDILKTYDLHANCFITKPVELDQFLKMIRSFEEYWFTIVKLPPEAAE